MKLILFYLVLFGLTLAGGYLFYFAECEVVTEFWWLTHVPGRCL